MIKRSRDNSNIRFSFYFPTLELPPFTQFQKALAHIKHQRPSRVLVHMLKFLQPRLLISTVNRIRRKAVSAAMTTSALSTPIPLKGSFSTEIPTLVYGTAWKKERTADLVYEALKAGFKGIDTAAQPRHYREDLVGDGIRRAISEGVMKREDIYVSPPCRKSNYCVLNIPRCRWVAYREADVFRFKPNTLHPAAKTPRTCRIPRRSQFQNRCMRPSLLRSGT
jgi:hypothetical protein